MVVAGVSMNLPIRTAAILMVAVLVLPARAADDEAIARMALCKDSWMAWKTGDPKRLEALGTHLRAEFTRHDNDAYVVPKAKVSVLGLKVLQLYPESVGMGVGFSLTLEARYDETRKRLEKALGKPLKHCEASDDMKSCELPIAPQRTVMLMAEDKPDARQTLIGCYYFYEK